MLMRYALHANSVFLQVCHRAARFYSRDAFWKLACSWYLPTSLAQNELAIKSQNAEGVDLSWKDVFQAVNGFKFNPKLQHGMALKDSTSIECQNGSWNSARTNSLLTKGKWRFWVYIQCPEGENQMNSVVGIARKSYETVNWSRNAYNVFIQCAVRTHNLSQLEHAHIY